MNGKSAKGIRKWCGTVWNNTPIEKREYNSLDEFVEVAKREWKRNPAFRTFVTELNYIATVKI